MSQYKRESVTGFQTRIGLNKKFTAKNFKNKKIKKYYKLKSKEAKLICYKKCLKLTRRVIDKIKDEFGQYTLYPQRKFETKFKNGEYKLDGITDLYGERVKISKTGRITKDCISIELKYTSTVKNAWNRYIKSNKGRDSITGIECTIENKYNLQAGFPGIVDPSIVCYLLVIHSDNKITLKRVRMKRDF